MSYAMDPSKPQDQSKEGYSAVNDDKNTRAKPLNSGNAKR